MSHLTTRAIESLRSTGKRKSEPVIGGGSLVARGLSKVISYTYVYTYNGSRLWYPIGEHSRDGDNAGSGNCTAYTLSGARKRAQYFSALTAQVGDIRAHFEAERAQVERERQQVEAERLADEQDTITYSLERLCVAYADYQHKKGKESAGKAHQLLNKWVIQKHPDIACKKAGEVTTQDVMVILRAIIDSGHTTTTNRVRSYLMAAYNYGIGSATDPLASAQSSGFNLTVNPVAPTKRVADFEKACDRVLTKAELAELLHRLHAMDKPAAKAVLLSLRLGGQRIRQLLAAQSYNPDTRTLTLLDSKGRRSEPRYHLLPVVDQALPLVLEALDNPHPRRTGLWQGLVETTVSQTVFALSESMQADSSIPKFALRDIRRTCETMLAGMGVSKDIRAQTQSHGVSGLQAKHYDRHDYLAEKKAALTAFNSLLDSLLAGTEQHDNVVAIRG